MICAHRGSYEQALLERKVGSGENCNVKIKKLTNKGLSNLTRLHQHVGEDEVLEASCSSGTSGLVIILEGLEEVGVSFVELVLPQVHLAAALPDHTYKKNSFSQHLKKSSYF